MTDLVTQARWFLIAAFTISLAYELYRATAKRGTSPHDSMEAFVRNNVAFYGVAAVVIALLFSGLGWAPWVGLLFSLGVLVASIVYYSPGILIHRQPGLVDWFEDVAFVALLAVAAALLAYEVAGITLHPGGGSS